MNGEFRAINDWERGCRAAWEPIRDLDYDLHHDVMTALDALTDLLRDAVRAGIEIEIPTGGLSLKSGEGA